MPPTSSLLIRRARILLPDGEFLLGDVQICDGKIVKVATEIVESGDLEIDSSLYR